MSREDFLSIAGSVFLFGMAYLDAGWRWFWAISGAVMLVWSLSAIFFGEDST